MSFWYFKGVYLVSRRSDKERPPLSDFLESPDRRWLGWDEQDRILYVVPTDSSLRSEHVTGSNRSRGIPIDRVADIWKVPRAIIGLKDSFELEVKDSERSGSTWWRFSERRRQGRLDDVLYVLRNAWQGWSPDPDLAELEDEDDEDYY